MICFRLLPFVASAILFTTFGAVIAHVFDGAYSKALAIGLIGGLIADLLWTVSLFLPENGAKR